MHEYTVPVGIGAKLLNSDIDAARQPDGSEVAEDDGV